MATLEALHLDHELPLLKTNLDAVIKENQHLLQHSGTDTDTCPMYMYVHVWLQRKAIDICLETKLMYDLYHIIKVAIIIQRTYVLGKVGKLIIHVTV